MAFNCKFLKLNYVDKTTNALKLALELERHEECRWQFANVAYA